MAQPSLFDASPSWPEGFRYVEDLIDAATEHDCLAHFAALDFGRVVMHGVPSRRRIVQYGWRYSFEGRALSATEAVPPWLEPVRDAAARWTGIAWPDLSEVLVTEYPPGATIGWHRDAPPFDRIAGVSFGAACRFRFRRGVPGSWETREIQLPPRSAYLLDGPARREWQHGIPPVKQLRYSVTFRTLRRPPRPLS